MVHPGDILQEEASVPILILQEEVSIPILILQEEASVPILILQEEVSVPIPVLPGGVFILNPDLDHRGHQGLHMAGYTVRMAVEADQGLPPDGVERPEIIHLAECARQGRT